MIILASSFFFILGIYIGLKVSNFLIEKSQKSAQEKVLNDINNVYKKLLNSFLNGKVKFKSRVNQICHLLSEIDDKGIVEVAYFLDKKEVAIFQNGVCIHTSELVEKETLFKISEFIESAFIKEINDVVNVLGLVLSKSEFEKNFNMKYDDLQRVKENLNLSEIDNIVSENSVRFDIDEILDKISEYGISSLTIEERLFLDNYSNEKRN